ncbi:MAG: arginine repressor [Gemmatimonadota bacterium]
MDEREIRHRAIRELLSRERIRTQARLVARLREQGHDITQASISRDLRALAVTKVRGVYQLPDDPRRIPSAILGLIEAAVPAGDHLMVVRTRVGAAQPVGVAIDEAGWPEVVGTIAGDDTIFIAVAVPDALPRIRSRLEVWASNEKQDNTIEMKNPEETAE